MSPYTPFEVLVHPTAMQYSYLPIHCTRITLQILVINHNLTTNIKFTFSHRGEETQRECNQIRNKWSWSICSHLHKHLIWKNSPVDQKSTGTTWLKWSDSRIEWHIWNWISLRSTVNCWLIVTSMTAWPETVQFVHIFVLTHSPLDLSRRHHQQTTSSAHVFSQTKLRMRKYLNKFKVVYINHSKISWYPKLLFPRENALASFWVQRVLVTHPLSQKLMCTCRWENIWTKVVHVNHQNNISSDLFQNIIICTRFLQN
jgi:hypothetical protein